MTYDPVRHKSAVYIERELEKLWENARTEKPGELHRTRRIAIEDMQRIIENDGLVYRLSHCTQAESIALNDSLGRLFGSNEERTNFFIDVVTTACKKAVGIAGAHLAIAQALWHSSQGENGLSGISLAIKALEESDLSERAA